MNYYLLGSILAIIGMALMLMVNLNRGAARKRQVWTRTDMLLQKWGSLAAYALIAFGLLFLLKR
jgi:hypothetical protein